MNKLVLFSDFSFIHSQIRDEIFNDFKSVYDNNWFINGKSVSEFESKFALFSNSRFAVGVSNGLDAIFLALKALGIGKGDEVIVPSNTFIATVFAVLNVGAVPVFVEPDYFTYNIDPILIEGKITKKTKAIIPVHLYGQACDMEAILEIAKINNLFVIEDNAQGHGAFFNDKITGSFGEINATSFYPGKNIGALGDGGAVTTNNESYASFIKSLRNYGSNKKYHHDILGYNMRLDELQSAFLNTKIKYIHQWNNLRVEVANRYFNSLKDIPEIILPFCHDKATHVYHLFVIRTVRRDELLSYLISKNIQVLIHYPIPPHLQISLSFLNYRKGDFVIAEELCETSLSLPIWPGISSNEIDYVTTEIKNFFNGKK